MEKFNEKYGVSLMFLLPVVIFTVAFMDHIVTYLILAVITFTYSFIMEKLVRESNPGEPREVVSKKVSKYVIPAVFIFIFINFVIVIVL